MPNDDKKTDSTEPQPQPVTILKTDRQMTTVRYSPCGKYLAAAGRDRTIRRWDVTESEPPSPPAEPATTDPLATTDKKDTKKPPAKPTKPPEPEYPALPSLIGHDGWVTRIEFHPSSTWLYSSDSWGKLCCWPIAEKEPKPAWEVPNAHDGWIRRIALSPDGKQLVSCGIDQKICLWSTTDGKKLTELIGHNDDVYSVAFHPDGKSLVSADVKGIVKHWDLTANKAVREFDAKVMHLQMSDNANTHPGGIRSLSFDLDGKTLACAGAATGIGDFAKGASIIRFITWESGQPVETLSIDNVALSGRIEEMTIHPSKGYWMGVVDGAIGKGLFFLLRPGEPKAFFTFTKLANCHSLSLHPNGRRLAVVSNAGEFGQARMRFLGKEGKYFGNTSPIHLWDLPA